jgi:hypothetical protein
LASTSVPFTLTTVQVPNLALTHKKRITVHTTRYISIPNNEKQITNNKIKKY